MWDWLDVYIRATPKSKCIVEIFFLSLPDSCCHCTSFSAIFFHFEFFNHLHVNCASTTDKGYWSMKGEAVWRWHIKCSYATSGQRILMKGRTARDAPRLQHRLLPQQGSGPKSAIITVPHAHQSQKPKRHLNRWFSRFCRPMVVTQQRDRHTTLHLGCICIGNESVLIQLAVPVPWAGHFQYKI